MFKGLKIGPKFIIGLVVVVLLAGGALWASNYLKLKGKQPTDPSLANVKARGKLVVGTSPPYGPMEYYTESGEIVGIDIDIAKEIALAIGVELEIKDIDFDVLLESVDSGEVDIAVAAITITPERSDEQLVSTPYFSGGQTLVVRADDETIKTPADLNGRKVGVEDDGTSLKDAIFGYVESPKRQLYTESEGSPYVSVVVAELKNRTIDAFVIDYIAGVDITKDNPDLKIMGEPFTQEFYGIATKKGNNSLMDEIEKVLREMKRSGKLDGLKDKWLK